MLLKLLFALPRARRWVRETIEAHASNSSRFRDLPEMPRLERAFPHSLLEMVRVVEVDQTPRPPLEAWGLHAADDFAGFNAAGLALRDTIFIRRGCAGDVSLLFHELVHVAQWRLLGVNRFLVLYGLMLLEDGYHASPLETMAFDLQRRFDARRQFDALPIIVRRTQEVLAAFAQRSRAHRLLVLFTGGRRLRRGA